LTSGVVQVASGIFHLGVGGLLFGGIGGNGMGSLTLAKRSQILDRIRGCRSSLRVAAKTHLLKCVSSSISGIINALGLQLPILLVGSLFGITASGYYLVANRTVVTANTLIGNAISQAFYGEAAECYRIGGTALRQLFLRTSTVIFLLSSTLSAVLWFVAPTGIPYLFGPRWIEAAEYTRWLGILLIGNLTCGSVSTMILVIRKQHLQIPWDVCRALLTIVAFYWASSRGLAAIGAVRVYVIFSLLAYLLWLLILGLLLRSATQATERSLTPALKA
jgi:O-antigen/teichoic acid export membrane protein